ncbi:cytoplasmic dynein 1 intermediate chain 1 isoform X1 [Lates japonicus]|uniref:Cytoplasmic dynein 1 intermediate chain 1 isoform X1 n=1 Tax=Lates japonicus TaxID=270547 RepID=A0AAD3MQM0_LATJO|nr:cytoplasmic dynein 1 intermediate chain 1 isoform X1 [Lates japonicus]
MFLALGGSESSSHNTSGQAPQDAMSDKSDLKAELERKKQRLAQIREEKKRKEEERKKKEVRKKTESQQKAEVTPEDSDLDRKRRETEALLQSIGISPEPPLVPTPVSPSKSVSTPSETGSQDSADGGAAGRSGFSKNKSQAQSARTLQWDTDPSVLQLQADSELGRRMQRLGASKITQVDFLPKEVVSYSKETQTPHPTNQSEVAKTAGSHVTVKGLYFLLPVIIIDGLVWIPLPSSTSNHHAHTHMSLLISIQMARLNSPHFLDRARNRSFIQQVHRH